MLRLFTVVLTTLLMISSGPALANCSPDMSSATVSRVAALISAQRAQAGLGAVELSSSLSRAAGRHACDMAQRGVRSHTGSDGSDMRARIVAAGYSACMRAENIAWGVASPERLMQLWMDSRSHRDNILHRRASEVGVAVAQGNGGPFWVLVLADPC